MLYISTTKQNNMSIEVTYTVELKTKPTFTARYTANNNTEAERKIKSLIKQNYSAGYQKYSNFKKHIK